MEEGKDGFFYPPFPVLGLATDGNQVLMTSGGGGSKSAKEIPNLIQVHRYDEATGKMSAVASMNTEKRVVVYLSYSMSNGLWLAGVEASCMMLQLDVLGSRLVTLCEWKCELLKTRSFINVAKFSPQGDVIATGGSDGYVKLWNPNGTAPPVHRFDFAKIQGAGEIQDISFSSDGVLLAICDETGVCRLHHTSSGQEQNALTFTNPQNQKKLNIRAARFIACVNGSSHKLAVSAGDARGPAYLAIYSVDGTLVKKVLVDKTGPITALAIHHSGAKAAVNTPVGGKRIYSIPQLCVLANVKNIHDLPGSSLEFMGEDIAVSGSGDRRIHVLTPKHAGGTPQQGGGGISIAYLSFVLVMLMIALYIIIRIGMKGAVLHQGQ